MKSFSYHNPVHIEFGEGALETLKTLVPKGARVLLLAGGGSIRANGVYDRVKKTLEATELVEFWGIEPNPTYETLMKAVELARKAKVDFLLSVGGGSVLDGTKFVAAAVPLTQDPWDLLLGKVQVETALPIGCVLTLPATGSEGNGGAVISRTSTQEKLYFGSPLVLPKFSILDPTTTVSLPARQTANGIVDAWVHVVEQYVSDPVNAPLQSRQAEAILLTLLEEGPKVLANPQDLAARANIMWCASQALNGLIGCGVGGDWSTHDIGHELTAHHGLDHARTLAIVLPGVWLARLDRKTPKLAQYGRRVFGLVGSDHDVAIAAVAATEDFFTSLGVEVCLGQHGIEATQIARKVCLRFESRGTRLGEGREITPTQVEAILLSRA